jgi:arylsulfatase A-like enzyme
MIEAVDSDYHRENTMVVFLADHGEMLGEHGYMGHGFGVYEELIRVPLFMRVPGLAGGQRVEKRVSITQLFYTVLDYFGFESIRMPYADEVDISCHSLIGRMLKQDCVPSHMISEAYAPENAVRIMRNHAPDLISRYNAELTQRAVYYGEEKMVAIEGLSKVLFNLAGDPGEIQPYQDEARIEELAKVLEKYLELSGNRRNGSLQQKISLKDEIVQQRLRDLGYIE